MIIILACIAAGLLVLFFFIFKKNNGAYPLFDGEVLLKVKLRGSEPGNESLLRRAILPVRLWLLEWKLRLLSPFIPLGPTKVSLSYAPVRRSRHPRAAGWEIYSQSGFMRAFHSVNLSLAGLITLFLLVYSFMGFTAKKAHSRIQIPPGGDFSANPPGEHVNELVAHLPGDCPPGLVASDCPVKFTAAGVSGRGADRLIASVQNPTAHPFKKKMGGSHVNSVGSHSNTGGNPHIDVAAQYEHFNAHTNVVHTNTTTAGKDHVNVDNRPIQ